MHRKLFSAILVVLIVFSLIVVRSYFRDKDRNGIDLSEGLGRQIPSAHATSLPTPAMLEKEDACGTTPTKSIDSGFSGRPLVQARQLILPTSSDESHKNSEPASPGTITIIGRVVYENDFHGYSPMRRVKVHLMDDDVGPDEDVAWQWTGDDGSFSFTVNNDDGPGQDGRDPYIKVEAENPAALCKSSYWDTGPYYMDLPKAGDDVPDGFYHDYGTWYPTSGYEAWQAIDAALTESDWIWARVSWSRPQLPIYWPYGDWPQFVYWMSGLIEHIELPQEPYGPNHDQRWFPHTVHHEYAHAVMYQLYGNSMPPDATEGPDPHYPHSESCLGFAWVEGWAEFMECAVENNPNNLQDAGGNIETNTWYNITDSNDMDGDNIEGSVASILWDIFDPRAETADNDWMYWGFDEIFAVVRYWNPDSILSFWSIWTNNWPDLSTSKGPLCSIYWHYGIDKDDYAPWGGSIDINADGWANGIFFSTSTSVILTLACYDWGSGAAYMRFRNSLSDPWSVWYPYNTAFSWTLSTGDGHKDVYVQFIDKKGYTSDSYVNGIMLDTLPPTGSIIINSGNPTYTYTRLVTLYLTYYDAGLGVYLVRYSNDGVWDTEEEQWMGYSDTWAWTLTPGNGLKTVYYQIRDYADRLSPVYSDTIILEERKPAVTLVVRGMNNKIYYNVWRVDGGWEGWLDTPGATTESPAADILEDNLHMVVRGMDGRLWHGYVSLVTNAFSGWTCLSGATPSPPALTVGYKGLILVVRGMDNRIYYRMWDRTSWNDWVVLPGATIDGPAAVAVGYADLKWLHIVVRGLDGSLWHGYVVLDIGGFSGWTRISGATLSRPALEVKYGKNSTSPGLVLVVRGLDNRIYYRTWNGLVGWMNWEVVPTGATNEGPAVANLEDKFHIVVIGLDGNLYHCYLTGDVWTPWTKLSGATPSPPKLALWI